MLAPSRSAFLTGPHTEGGSRGRVDQKSSLVAAIHAAFPALRFSRTRMERTGGDHLLLIVDERLAFRFPREGMHDLRLEIAVLDRLRRKSSLAVPDYRYIDPAGRFAGYPLIEGVALTAARFAKLSGSQQAATIKRTATFLTELHALPEQAVEWAHSWPRMWTAAEFADHALVERLPLIAKRVPHLAEKIAAFYRAYRADLPPEEAIVHGDLVEDHLLVDPTTGAMAGIIDFGDVALGDPAADLACFWFYGAEAIAQARRAYRPRNPDPGVFDRARNHFIRARIDRLHDRLVGGSLALASPLISEVEALLDAPADALTKK